MLPTIPRRTGRQINQAGHPADNPSQVWQRSMYYPFMDYYTVDVRFDTCKTDFLVIVLSDIRILVTLLVSFGHCVVWSTDSDCPFSIFCLLCCLIYRFWLPLWYLLVIVFSDIQILIAPLVSFGHCVVSYTDSDCPFGIFWSLCCLIYGFWLPLWYLLVIVLSNIRIMIAPLVSFGHCVFWYTDSDCPFGIFWSLCCLIYGFWFPLWYLLVIVLSDIQFPIAPLVYLVIVLSDIQFLIAPLVSFGHCVVWYTDSDCPFGVFWSLCCLIYRFWFPLLYLLVIVLSDIQILIAPLVYFGHCVDENSYNRIVWISFRHVNLAFVFLFFQKWYLRPEGKIQKAHSKVATISDPDNAAARGVKPLRQFRNCD